MIRLLRGIIYGIAAGITAAIVLDYLEEGRHEQKANPGWLLGRHPDQKTTAGPSSGPAKTPIQSEEDLSDEARQALLDELGAQLQ
jgi:hypothetical protein